MMIMLAPPGRPDTQSEDRQIGDPSARGSEALARHHAVAPRDMDFEAVVAGAKALADPTRMRLVALLDGHEYTVSELCDILQQSQPRVSRHLKLLAEAGLVSRQAEGTWAYYRLTQGVLAQRCASLVDLVDRRDGETFRDGERAETVRRRRDEEAGAYFERIAGEWDELRAIHVADRLVEQAVLDALPAQADLRVLDLGTGTGRMLEVVADRAAHGVGVDLSPKMLQVARARLEAAGHRHLRVQHGSISDLAQPRASQDVAILHQVLHFVDEPAPIFEEVARVLVPGGVLVIVDFAPHELEELRTDFAHRRLGVRDEDVRRWAAGAGLFVDRHVQLAPQKQGDGRSLTVSLWRAVKHAEAEQGDGDV